MIYPYKMQPVYKNYIWGGNKFYEMGKNVPNKNIAESWELSIISGSESKISNGDLVGMKFLDVIEKYGQLIIGNTKKIKIPLVKFIDASDKLSIQVHPDDKYAFINEKGKKGKTEMWYVVDAKPGANIIHGFKDKLKEKDIVDAILNGKHEEIYREVPVKRGDVIFVPAGTVHALNEGIAVVEVQQQSDITYRLYDYNRKDSIGKTRPLHIEKALNVINFKNCRAIYKGLQVSYGNSLTRYLTITDKFCVRTIESKGIPFEFVAEGRYSIFVFLNGEAYIDNSCESLHVDSWETVFIPAYMGRYKISGRFIALQIFLPDSTEDILNFLNNIGFSKKEIMENVAGFE